MQSGTTYYQDGDVAVSDTQLTLGSTTYDLSNIATVSLIRPILNRTIGWITAAVGLIIGVAGYLVWGTFLSPMLGGLALLIAGLVVVATVRESYTVRMSPLAGQPVLIQFTNPVQAQKVVTAIGSVIAKRPSRQENPPLERELGA
jgi:hypothetical protein